MPVTTHNVAANRGGKLSRKPQKPHPTKESIPRDPHSERGKISTAGELRNRREVRQPSSMSLPGQSEAGKDESFAQFMSRIEQANYKLGATVTTFEESVNIQGTTEENVDARIKHARTREAIRKESLTMQEDLMSKMNDGTLEDNRSQFFTQCYNFTNCVDRFMKALAKSLAKERKRLESNRAELEKIQKSHNLSEEERADALSQCEGVEEITKEKEKTIMKIKDEMSNLIQQLRYQASADVAAAKTTDDGFEDEGAVGQLLVSDHFKRKAPYFFIAALFLTALILGSLKWYLWWTQN